MTPQQWKRIHNLVLGVVTGIVVVLTIFPIVWMIISSLQTNNGLLTGRISFQELHFSNFVSLWTQVKFAVYFRNSLIICGVTMILSTALACLSGYALARFRFRGAELFGYAVLGTQMIPGIMFLLPLYMMFLWIKKTVGLPMVDTYWGMIGVYTAFFTPMSIFIMRGFFAAIPKELEEAALIDGCSHFSAFLRVILPVSLPGLIATGVYVFLTAWDELLFAWVLTTTNAVQTIPVGIRLYVGQYNNRYDLLMAAAVVTTIPVMITFFATQRWFISGMTAGSVKG